MIAGSGPLFAGPDVASWQTVAVVAAQPSQPNQPEEPGRGDDFGKSSPVGLLVLLLFFIAVAFLVRSMTKHLKKVPASFDRSESEEAPPVAEPRESAEAQGPADDSVDGKK